MAKAGNKSVQQVQEVQAPRSMASQGATLQDSFDRFDSDELVVSIKELQEKKQYLVGEINRQMEKERGDKARKLEEISILNGRLQQVEGNIVRKIMARNDYDKTSQETEAAFMKLIEHFSS
eukprot:TRINITY_DN859_c0_g3_i1.p1 TRINITY_DN859_c0_g3~~TRINITY_DN859_c0_g3_i1.p1  ORF type:complete len:139 (+),score=39.71 TRINITY_DN859_c0_g3_i1:57-419(+)